MNKNKCDNCIVGFEDDCGLTFNCRAIRESEHNEFLGATSNLEDDIFCSQYKCKFCPECGHEIKR